LNINASVTQDRIRKILKDVSGDKTPDDYRKTRLLLVHHLLPTHTPFFRILIEFFQDVVLIPIPYSYDAEAAADLDNPNLQIDLPESLESLQSKISSWIDRFVENQEPFLIIEVGGYSAQCIYEKADILSESLICVIEDTENGMRAHETSLKRTTVPWTTFSVARSPLKNSEDILTGDAIAFSLDRLLRQMHDLIVGKRVTILGFGKIGAGLGRALEKYKCEICVYDTNPIRRIDAYAHGFNALARNEAISSADVIVGVSGFNSLSGSDFQLLKDGVILASGSSKRIEFMVDDLLDLSKNIKILAPNITQYVLHSGKSVILLNDGKPINFIDRGIVGRVLELIWIEILCILSARSESSSSNKILELAPDTREMIASCWIKTVVRGGGTP